MKRLIALALVFVLALSGCAINKGGPNDKRVYCIETQNGHNLISYELLPLQEGISVKEKCEAVLNRLMHPQEEGHSAAVPSDIEIEGYSVSPGEMNVIIYIDFTPAYRQLPNHKKSLVSAVFALSLFQLEQVAYVCIRAEGIKQPPFPDWYITRDSLVTDGRDILLAGSLQSYSLIQP